MIQHVVHHRVLKVGEGNLSGSLSSYGRTSLYKYKMTGRSSGSFHWLLSRLSSLPFAGCSFTWTAARSAVRLSAVGSVLPKTGEHHMTRHLRSGVCVLVNNGYEGPVLE